MKETRADTRAALLQALGLHVVLFATMFAGLQWTRSNVAEAAQAFPQPVPGVDRLVDAATEEDETVCDPGGPVERRF